MKPIKQFILLGLFFSLPYFSFAWGVLGHRIVGEIASSYLTEKAKSEIRKVLGNESIAITSNWADFIKSDSTFNYLSSWHYVNLDKGLTRDQLQSFFKKDTAIDLYTRINFLVKELKNKKLPLEKKKMYLRLLIHFVGDAHQPMHTGRKEDLGGNRIKVNWFNTPTNLHAVWDESLVNFQQLSYTEYTTVINHATPKQVKAWQRQPVSEWLIESYQIAETLYPEITEANQKLSYNYNFKHIATVKEAKQKYKASLFRVGFENGLPLIQHESFSTVKTEDHSVVVKIHEGHSSNEVLQSFLAAGTTISSFNEILPSLNDIFIELVEGTPAARQFQNITA